MTPGKCACSMEQPGSNAASAFKSWVARPLSREQGIVQENPRKAAGEFSPPSKALTGLESSG
jgi:hypothetical protein